MPLREAVIAEIRDRVLLAQAQESGRLRVAVDGRDAAGKTTFADALGTALKTCGVEVYRAGIDDWLFPREVRYQRGRENPEAFYLDTFDYLGVVRDLLNPFAAGGTCRLAAYDVTQEAPVEGERITPGDRAVLVVDGIFLQRPELRSCWNLSIYLDVDPAVALERGVRRDTARSGNEEAERRLYAHRYHPGQEIYHEAVNPKGIADLVVNNTNFDWPVIVRS